MLERESRKRASDASPARAPMDDNSGKKGEMPDLKDHSVVRTEVHSGQLSQKEQAARNSDIMRELNK